MKILFVADGRSPIAINWMKYWIKPENEVFLVSTYPAAPSLAFSSVDFVPAAFSRAKPAPDDKTHKKKSLLWSAATLKLRMGFRHWLGPSTLPGAARQLNRLIAAYRPDIVHAMRIPYEGMLAATAKKLAPAHFPPLLVSIWGNDFTLHAPASPLMQKYTRQTLQRADALHADCRRDIRLAQTWDFDSKKPQIVLPGAGGIDQKIFHPPEIPSAAPLVVNPRGFRSYVRNDTFFKAIPSVLEKLPETKFICPSMAGEKQAKAWIAKFGIQASVTLTPPLKQKELAKIFRSSQILVSPSTHDGTPNSLLEGMACGAFPIAGDLESIREWITPGKNGLLIDPADENNLAQAMIRALNDDNLRKQAVKENQKIIASHAEYTHSMAKAEFFYKRVIQEKRAFSV